MYIRLYINKHISDIFIQTSSYSLPYGDCRWKVVMSLRDVFFEERNKKVCVGLKHLYRVGKSLGLFLPNETDEGVHICDMVCESEDKRHVATTGTENYVIWADSSYLLGE